MASITKTIEWLEKLPEEIGQKGEDLVKENILKNGHFITGRMYHSTRHQVWEGHARIWTWTRYATFVNDGRKEVRPIAKKALYWEHPVSLPHPVKKAVAYPGSHFFDHAYNELNAWCSQL